MVQIGAPGREPIPIGEAAAPPFARLPDPSGVFAARAARFRQRAVGHDLRGYLELLAGLSDIQDAVARDLHAPEVPSPDDQARQRGYGMPPIDRTRLPEQPVCQETIRRFMAGARALSMPEDARDALERVTSLDADGQAWMARTVLDGAAPGDHVAEHVFVSAALQVHAARVASRLDAKQLGPVGEGACPVCASPPVSSMVVGWQGADGARFCVCSLCATLWNAVRVRCTHCGSTKGIGYTELDGQGGTIKAETCSECRTYLKVLYQVKDPTLDPVADDVATVALDMLVGETGFRRGGTNPFLTGY